MFGIIGAMEKEVELIKELLVDVEIKEYSHMLFYKGKLHGEEVVVCKSGVGKVFAAMCAEIMILMYDVTAIINTGAAGSLHNEMNIGDILISTGAVHYDVDATVFGYERGQVPSTDKALYPADKRLIHLIQRVCEHKFEDSYVFEGLVASGDQFISTDAKKEWIKKHFEAYCCEMEGASIAQVAAYNDVPFVIIRSISDKADGSQFKDYEEFENEAARKSALLVEKVVQYYNRVKDMEF